MALVVLDLEADGVLVLAGAVAGVLGTAGGITSLVSYPALLAVGVPALPANVANLVALVACWPGAALASRRELTGQGSWLTRGLLVAAVAAATGSGLLLVTPSGAFARIVPLLVAAGALTLLAQPALTALRQRWDRRNGQLLLLISVGILSIYSGYFGAGSGVMLLAAVAVLLDPGLPRANALKNMLVGASAVASAVVFVLAGPVIWAAVLPLALGLFLGSTVGPVVARRVPERLVRWCVATLGLALAVRLWLHPA
jgi:uncharacterized protein